MDAGLCLAGKRESKMHPANTISIGFWTKVVDEVTEGSYELVESCQSARYRDGSLGTIISFNIKR
jgi:hypothetical protein